MADITTLSKIILTAVDNTKDAFGSVKSGLNDISGTAKAATAILGALGALGAGAFLVGAIKGAIDTTAAFKDMSEKSGLAVETLSALKTAATLTGTDFDVVVKGGTKLAKTLYDAAGSGGEAAAAFKALGVDIRDAGGAVRSQDAILLDVAKRFAEMEDGTAKTALAQKLLGKAGAELIPILNDIGEAGEFVGKVTKEQAAIADDLQKTWIKLTTSGKGMWTTIATQITPALDALAHGFLNVLNGAGGLKGTVAELAADGTLAAWAQKAVIIMAEVADAIVDAGNAFTLLVKTFKAGGEYIAGMYQLIVGGFRARSGDWAGGLAEMTAGMDRMKQSTHAVVDEFSSFTASTKFKDAVIQQIVAMSAGVETTKKYTAAIVDLKGATDPAAKALADAFNVLAHAKQDLDDLGKTADEKTTPAMRKLLDLYRDPAFAKFSANVKAAIADALTQADAIQRETAARKAALEAQAAFLKNLNDLNDSLGKQQALLDAELDSLQHYGLSMQGTAQASVAFELTQGKLANTLALLDATYPQVAAALRDYLTAQAESVDVTRAIVASEKDYIAARKNAIADMARGIEGIQKEIESEKMRAASIGLTRAELVGLHIVQAEAYLDSLRTAEGSDVEIKAAELRIAKLKELRGLVGNTDALEQSRTAWVNMINDVSRAGADFIVDFVEHGSVAFKNLWANFKAWALRAFAEIAARKVVVSLIGNASGVAGASDGGASGGGGFGVMDIAKLFSNTGSSSALLSALGGSEALGLAGTAAGAALGAGFSAGVATLTIAAEAGVAAIGGLGAAMGAMAAVAIPVIGWIAAAGILLYALLGNKGGGPKTGGFGSAGDVSGITGTDSSGRYFTPNQADSDIGKSLDQANKSYLDIAKSLGLQAQNVGFALGFDTDPQGTANNRVHAGTFVNGKQIYNYASNDSELGRDDKVLQDRLALESKRIIFAALQASLGDAPTYIKTLFEGVDASTVSSDDIDRILGTAAALKVLVAVVGGLGDQFAKMDAEQIQSLVEAFGGLQAFLESAAFMQTNFTTDAQKASTATQLLADQFAAIGEKVPATHQAFTDLLASFDLTTEEGRAAYVSVSKLAPLFVEVNGTAEQAAAALAKVAAELKQFTTDNFTTKSQQHQTDVDTMTADFAALGIQIPKTHAEFLALMKSWGLSDVVLLRLEKEYVAANGTAEEMAQAERDLAGARQSALAYFHQNFDSPEQKIAAFWDTVHAAWTKYGGQLQGLGFDHIPTSSAGFRQFILDLQTAAAAEEDLNGPLHQMLDYFLALAPTIVDLNSATQDMIDSANDARQATDRLADAYDRSAQAASEVQTRVSAIMSGIGEIVSGSGGDFGERLALTMSLIPEQIATLNNELEEAYKSGDIYGPLPTEIKQTIAALQGQNAKAAAQLARYTVLAAQYDSARAEQLVNLEDWFERMKAAVGNSPEALAALQVTFDTKWKAIVDGTSTAVDDVASQLEKLQQSIRDFLDSLKLGDLSPLTPSQKLGEAQIQYQTTLSAAQAGDLDALAKLPDAAKTYLEIARDFYASSQAYTDIFNGVYAALDKLAAPDATDHPMSPEAAMAVFADAIPTGSTLASKADIAELKAENSEALAGVADAASADTAELIAALSIRLDRIADAVGAQLK